ncbi:uncharacterized protein BT62DRAFT_1074771 [Guyanagaster necrorhizus]|uniref:Uncharacterized protein n=1 Tax=Guyanagaster necrorhizus TaxID=856835 RepID=A0A9P8AVV3_9AGAR|nr:uncharacterized protein BT62DRAFT_1074771 [Guyanagaster necrorhizus MCA 3950]KAG7448282.1 hypothetical protein BT62DRAFT_1074771 [Guyanagaster necrorhizus MCA 3950]
MRTPQTEEGRRVALNSNMELPRITVNGHASRPPCSHLAINVNQCNQCTRRATITRSRQSFLPKNIFFMVSTVVPECGLSALHASTISMEQHAGRTVPLNLDWRNKEAAKKLLTTGTILGQFGSRYSLSRVTILRVPLHWQSYDIAPAIPRTFFSWAYNQNVYSLRLSDIHTFTILHSQEQLKTERPPQIKNHNFQIPSHEISLRVKFSPRDEIETEEGAIARNFNTLLLKILNILRDCPLKRLPNLLDTPAAPLPDTNPIPWCFYKIASNIECSLSLTLPQHRSSYLPSAFSAEQLPCNSKNSATTKL